MPDRDILRYVVWIVPALVICLVLWRCRGHERELVVQVPEFSAEVKQAWQARAARMGWVVGEVQPSGMFLWIFNEDRRWARGPSVLPAFELKEGDPEVLGALPVPARPFALILSVPRVTRSCLKSLRRFQSLEALWIGPGDVQPGALAVLAELPNLRHLSLWRTNITDTEGRHLGKCKELRSLDLRETRVGNATVRALVQLPKLAQLSLDGTRVGDSCCRYLARMSELRYLSLNATAVGDACLEHLKGARKLEQLFLFDTRVTAARLDAFRAAHPNCNVGGPSAELPSR